MKRSLSRPIAYELENEAFLEPLQIRQSANAWWMDKGKLNVLIYALKLGGSIKDACLAAEISPDQYKYFLEIHPEFSTKKARLKMELHMIARYTIYKHLDQPNVAKWYLTKRCPEEFGAPSQRVVRQIDPFGREDEDSVQKTELTEKASLSVKKVTTRVVRNRKDEL